MSPRYFILSGGTSPADLIDRAGQHGIAGRAVAHAAPGRDECYGAVEVSRANPGDRRPGGLPMAGLIGGDEGAGMVGDDPRTRGAQEAMLAPGEPEGSRFAASNEGGKQEAGAP